MGKARPTVVMAAAVLAWSFFAGSVSAQPQDAQPQDAQAKSTQAENGESDRAERQRDQENNAPQTIQTQMQALRREQRKEKGPTNPAPVRDRDHQFALGVPNYIKLRERNIVMQQRDYSCGAACLATICRYYWGDDVTEDMVLVALDALLTDKEVEDRIKNGLAMSDLRRAAVKLGYQSVVGKTTFAKLTEAKVPMIVGIQPSGHKHFVVYRGTDLDYIYMADPIRGNVRMPVWEFTKQWQENAVLVIHKPGQKVKKVSPLSLREEETRVGDLNDYLIQTQQSRQPQNNIKLQP